MTTLEHDFVEIRRNCRALSQYPIGELIIEAVEAYSNYRRMGSYRVEEPLDEIELREYTLKSGRKVYVILRRMAVLGEMYKSIFIVSNREGANRLFKHLVRMMRGE